MTQKTKIHVIGSYAVGMTMRTNKFPKEGETVPGYNFCQLHGGKGSNQAVGVSRMGADVLFTSAVGKDPLGESALKMLKSEGIRTESVFTLQDVNTGVGFVMVGDTGENEILIDLGANEKLSNKNIDKAFSVDFDADLLLVQLEANLDAVFYALKLAKKQGIPVILNPAPYRSIPDEFIRLATYITPNQTEAEGLFGASGSPEELCQGLKDKYNVNVILTAGNQGAFYTEDDKIKHLGVEEVDVRDSTGAGDCFNAALAVMLAEKKSLSEAVRVANTSATYSVQIDGVLESLPQRKLVEIELEKKRKENYEEK
jgi:ribokinase